MDRCCSRCGQNKTNDMFIPKRNICKECRNKRAKEKYTEEKSKPSDYEKDFKTTD